MRTTERRLAAAITVAVTGAFAAFELRPADRPALVAQARPAAVEVRTQVVRRTVTVVRHVRAPSGARTLGAARGTSGARAIGAARASAPAAAGACEPARAGATRAGRPPPRSRRDRRPADANERNPRRERVRPGAHPDVGGPRARDHEVERRVAFLRLGLDLERQRLAVRRLDQQPLERPAHPHERRLGRRSERRWLVWKREPERRPAHPHERRLARREG